MTKIKEKPAVISNYLGISIGVSDFHVRDELASPLTYRNIGPTAKIKFMIKGDKDEHVFEITGTYSSLESKFAEFYAENGRVGLKYDYLHRFYRLNKNNNYFELYLGLGLSSYGSFSEYKEKIGQNMNITTSTWYFAHSIEMAASFDYFIGKSNHISFGFNFPLISNVSRPQYSCNLSSSDAIPFKLFGENVPFWENTLLQNRIEFEHNLYRWLSIFGVYEFQYSKYNKPRITSMYMNNFRLGVLFGF